MYCTDLGIRKRPSTECYSTKAGHHPTTHVLSSEVNPPSTLLLTILPLPLLLCYFLFMRYAEEVTIREPRGSSFAVLPSPFLPSLPLPSAPTIMFPGPRPEARGRPLAFSPSALSLETLHQENALEDSRTRGRIPALTKVA